MRCKHTLRTMCGQHWRYTRSLQASTIASSSQSFVALNIIAIAGQWSLTALLNRSMLCSPKRLPSPHGSEGTMSTNADNRSAVSSQQSAVSSQQSAVSSQQSTVRGGRPP